MIRELRASGRMELTVLLSAMAVLCFSMSLTRYLITDSKLFLFLNWNLFLTFLPWLFHLRNSTGAPLWFDLVLILAFAWTGLSYGFISLLDIESLMLGRFRKPAVIAMIVFLLFLSGFGIYLGRYLRWNSWDVLHSPLDLLFDVGDRLVNPFSHSRTWGVTLTMGILLNMMYRTLKGIRKSYAPQRAP